MNMYENAQQTAQHFARMFERKHFERWNSAQIEWQTQVADSQEAAPSYEMTDDLHLSYENLKFWIQLQYCHLIDEGWQFVPFLTGEEPYKNSQDLFQRVEDEQVMQFFPTVQEGHESFGDNSGTDGNHPFLDYAPFWTGNGYRMTYNDLFRCVHDVIGHIATRQSFGMKGEFCAFLSHVSTLPRNSWDALILESIAQSAWVTCNPAFRRSDGSIPTFRDSDFTPLSERPFSEQKVYQPDMELYIPMIENALKYAMEINKC